MLIAEIGQNFLGLMDLATDLIRLAKENGADLAKFQLYSHETLYKDHPEIPNVELSFEQAKGLFEYGKQVGIEVLFSVFDVERVRWCEEIGVNRYKIACDKLTDELWYSIPAGAGLIVSYSPRWNKPRPGAGLYCIPRYPAWASDYRFGEIDFVSGYDGISDHTIGLDAAKIALARGAQIIEKHFSIAHDVGIDGAWSMVPDELAELKRWETVCEQVL